MGLGIMRPFSRDAIARRGAAVLLCATFALLAAPGVAIGASVTFGTPSAKSTFGTGIVFAQPYSSGGVKEADIVIQQSGDPGPYMSVLQSAGSSTLTFTLDTSSGGLSPFEPVDAHFQVVLTDGSVQAGPNIHVVYADDRFTWKSKSGKLVTIHWIQGTDAFGQQLLTYGEQGFSKSAVFLGVNETKPVDFYVYPSQSAFQGGLSVPETIGGQTQPSYRTCFALVAPNELTTYGRTVVPHELAHMVISDLADNPYHGPARWLNEGLAVYLSQGYDSSDRQLVADGIKNGTLRPLASLASYFPLDADHIYLSYAESVAAVDFMVRKYGQASIQALVRAYAKGVTDDEAFTAALGIDAAAFNTAWLAGIGLPAPTTYGPQPAPTGPVPPGWTGSSSTEPPIGPAPSTATATASTASGGQWPKPLDGTESPVYVLAGLIAVVGLILLGAGILLYAQSRHERTPSDWPPS